ncbi:hypothetical protein AB0J74_33175 [Asanoa sp. NPDC049573]|uniref:hypothetical protein n=1 Tax=Asanoa sp. NPDC049573 TaxID=3155396 RepID=UPI0034277867
MIDPSAFVQAINNTREHVNSARPQAPVVHDRERVQGRGDPFRRSAAALLRRWADRVEPHRPRPCSAAAA